MISPFDSFRERAALLGPQYEAGVLSLCLPCEEGEEIEAHGVLPLVEIHVDRFLPWTSGDDSVWQTQQVLGRYANAVQSVEVNCNPYWHLHDEYTQGFLSLSMLRVMAAVNTNGGLCLKSITIAAKMLWIGGPGAMRLLRQCLTNPDMGNLTHVSILRLSEDPGPSRVARVQYAEDLAVALAASTRLERLHLDLGPGDHASELLESLFARLAGYHTDHSWLKMSIEANHGTALSFQHLGDLFHNNRIGQRLQHLIITNIRMSEVGANNIESAVENMPGTSLVDLESIMCPDDSGSDEDESIESDDLWLEPRLLVDNMVDNRWRENGNGLRYAIGCVQENEEHPSARIACFQSPEFLETDALDFLDWFVTSEVFITNLERDAEQNGFSHITDPYKHICAHLKTMVAHAEEFFFHGRRGPQN